MIPFKRISSDWHKTRLWPTSPHAVLIPCTAALFPSATPRSPQPSLTMLLWIFNTTRYLISYLHPSVSNRHPGSFFCAMYGATDSHLTSPNSKWILCLFLLYLFWKVSSLVSLILLLKCSILWEIHSSPPIIFTFFPNFFTVLTDNCHLVLISQSHTTFFKLSLMLMTF